MEGSINRLLDEILEAKAQEAEKSGRPVTVEQLISGWQGFRFFGVSEEQVRAKALMVVMKHSKENTIT